MNTSVNIGSSQDFRLSRALLVYGTSSYQGFPSRHPFVTLHEVIHDDKGAQLAAGQLMTVQMLADLMMGLGHCCRSASSLDEHANRIPLRRSMLRCPAAEASAAVIESGTGPSN